MNKSIVSKHEVTRFTDFIQSLPYDKVYALTTLFLAVCITVFYIAALKNDFNPSNPLAALPSLVHVTASIGITLLMTVTPALSLMRLVQLVTLLLLANLG